MYVYTKKAIDELVNNEEKQHCHTHVRRISITNTCRKKGRGDQDKQVTITIHNLTISASVTCYIMARGHQNDSETDNTNVIHKIKQTIVS